MSLAAAAGDAVGTGRRRLPPAAVLAAGAAAATGVTVGWLATGPLPLSALLFPLLLVPLILWRRPALGLYAIFAAAVSVEQFEYMVGPREGAVTAKVPVFQSVVEGTGITPVEVLLGTLAVVWVLRAVRDRRYVLPRSTLALHVALWLGLALLYLALGLARGGNVTMALWEVRPFVYFGVAYALAAMLLTSKDAVRALLWIVVLGCAAKAAYGMLIFASVRDVQPRPEAVLAHEESFFFGVYVVVTLGLWVFRQPGRLRTVATACLPLVLLADMVNSRRTAWAIVLGGALVLMVVAFVVMPSRRRVIVLVGLVLAVSTSAYLPAFWGGNGALAQPARAVQSVIAPSERDLMSNDYRFIEDNNLLMTVQSNSSLGAGFGHPIRYVGLVDLSDISSSLAYIPHNGVLYVWMRMGLLGQVALWLLIYQSVFAACRLARVREPSAAMFGAVVVCAVVAWVIMGNKDMGFTWFRIAFAMGIMLGAVEAQLTRLTGSARSESPSAVVNAGAA